jgi:hypothetical protein
VVVSLYATAGIRWSGVGGGTAPMCRGLRGTLHIQISLFSLSLFTTLSKKDSGSSLYSSR